jgi:hypothetical protein
LINTVTIMPGTASPVRDCLGWLTTLRRCAGSSARLGNGPELEVYDPLLSTNERKEGVATFNRNESPLQRTLTRQHVDSSV